MKVHNTAKDDPLLHALTAMEPDGVEAQEARGQRQLVASSQLPTLGLQPKAKALGIKVIAQSDGDELFSDVTLPAGWTLKATDHSMWSELLDAEGKRRASIFYKAAFYDRHAEIHWE